MHELHYKRPLWVWMAYLLIAIFLVVFSAFVGYMIFGFIRWVSRPAEMRWDVLFYAIDKSFKISKTPFLDIFHILLTLPVFYLIFKGMRKAMNMRSRLGSYFSLLALTIALLINSIFISKFFGDLLPMVQRTISIAFFGCVIGFFIGLVIVGMRMSVLAPLRWLSYGWVYIFRGTPFILQAYFFWNLSGLLLSLGWADSLGHLFFYIGLPFMILVEKLNYIFIGFLQWPIWDGFLPYLDSLLGSQMAQMEQGQTFADIAARKTAFLRQFNRSWNSPYWWVLVATAINSSAYGSEIIRGGILSVQNSQMEAAKAFGMSRSLTFRRIRLKQAIAQALPAYSNEVILVLKATVVASAALSFVDFWDGYSKAASKFSVIFFPLVFIGACYFVTNYGLSILFKRLEVKANPWIYKNQA